MLPIAWIVLYLALGIALSRWLTHRFPNARVSKLDAFALIVAWPLLPAYLLLRAVVNAIGTVGGGR